MTITDDVNKTCDLCGFPIIGQSYEVSWREDGTPKYRHSDQARCLEIRSLRRQLAETHEQQNKDARNE